MGSDLTEIKKNLVDKLSRAVRLKVAYFRGNLMRFGAVVVLVILLGGIASAQYDPGIRDSVSFGPWEAIVPADSPWSGNIRVPIRVFNDEFLKSMDLVFEYGGPWKAEG